MPTLSSDSKRRPETLADAFLAVLLEFAMDFGPRETLGNTALVPLAGIEPALLAESDFESDASTSSAIGARAKADGGI